MPHETHMSVAWMIGVFVALMVLLILTVVAAWFPLGPGTLVISLVIAAAKAALVVLYFMHIRYSSRITYIFVGAGLLWLSILFTLTFAEVIGRTQISRTYPAWNLDAAPGGKLETTSAKTAPAP